MSEPLCLPEHGSTHGGTVDTNGALGDAFSTTTASNKEKDDTHDTTSPNDKTGDNVNVCSPKDITSQTKDDSEQSLNNDPKDDDLKDDDPKNDDPKDDNPKNISNVGKDKDSTGTTSPQRVVRKINRGKLPAKVTVSEDNTSTTSTGKRTRDDQKDNKVKVDALRKLWLNADVATFFKVSGIPPPAFDEEKAEKAVEGYIDYFQGRMIKADFSQFVEGNVSIFSAYDRDFGQGRAKKALGW